MLHYLIKTTDDFICINVKSIFENLEKNCKNNNKKINIFQELKNLEFDPLVKINDESSEFEKKMKLQLKIIIGIFFVLVPLIPLLVISYVLGIQYTYAFLITFLIAIFASTRTSKIAERYSNFRHSLT